MGKAHRPTPPLSEQLRQAVLQMGVSSSALARATGLSEWSARRFLEQPAAEHWSSTLDAIARFAGLRLARPRRPACCRRQDARVA